MKARLSLLAFLFAFAGFATVHNVSVGSNFFTPSSLTITQGDTVLWSNTGGTHNVDGSNGSNPVTFGNGSASSSAWTYQFQFTVAGSYNYVCTPHAPGMAGSVTVLPLVSAPVSQGFETGAGTWNYTNTPAAYNMSSDVWDIVSSLSSINPSEGSSFWGMRDLDNPNGGGSFAHTLDFDAVDVSSLPNARVKFDYYTIGFDGSDSLAYVVEFDNGSTWGTPVLLNKDSQSWVTVDVAVPSSASYVRLRIYAVQNGGSDYAAVDNFRVEAPQVGAGGIPDYNISDVNSSDVNGVADSLNVECRLHGIVHSIDFDGNAGYSLYMYDATGGINVFSFNDVSSYTNPAVGDSIRVIGSIAQFNGLTEIVPDSIVLLGSGVSLKQPSVVTAPDESVEGDYIKLNGYWVIDASQWPASGSSASVAITNGADTTTLRIDSDTDIDGSPVPTAPFNVTGAGGQFDNSSPFDEGYQILPSSLLDIEARPASSIPYYTISQVTTNDANGEPDSLNVVCELRGVVHSIDFDSNAGYSLYMYDATGGINVFNFNDVATYSSPNPGDSISVFGDIAQFNGLTEIFADSIVLWSAGLTLKSPLLVTVPNEVVEGDYIRLNGYWVVTPSQWPAAGSDASVTITNGTDTTILRIDRDTDIDGTTVPAAMFDVIGAAAQFDNTSPFDEGYQILPSSLSDILLTAPANPTVNYPVSSQIVSESVGTVTVDLIINPTASTSETITLQAALGAGVTIPNDGSITPAPNFTTGIFTLTVPANEDSVSFDITIIDDAVVESNETLFVNITGVSAGLLMGSGLNYQLVVQDNDAPAPGIPTYDIADITTADASGIPDSLNVYCKLNGVVYTDDFDGNAGISFFMYDATGGVNVFNFNDVSNYAVKRGDSIRVIGEIQQFNGLIELVPDSIVRLDSNLTLKNPAVVTDLDETTEGEYIRMNGFSVVTPSQWPANGNSANVDITDGTVTVTLRIDSDTDIDGSPVPTGQFDVVGAGGQFDNSNPYTSGYQIQPRDLNDIIPIVVTTPTINFPLASQSQVEAAGTVTINMPIAPATTAAGQVKIYVSNGVGVTTGDYTTTPAVVNDTITLAVAANASSVSFDVNLIADGLNEVDEDITFTIAATSTGINTGATSTHVFTIIDDIPLYDIIDVVDVDANGEADSLNVYCKLEGIVSISNLGFNRFDFYLTARTNNAGIKVFKSNLSGFTYNPIVGDEIRVVGIIDQFNGQIEIIPDSISVISSGNTLTPFVQTALGETTEGRLIRLNGVEMVDTTGWPTANFGNFDIVLPTNDTVILRIDSDIIANWGSAPVGKFDVIGIGGQYDPSSPYTDEYQILPRGGDDIIRILPTVAITEVMPNSSHPSIDGDWFELTNYGNAPIDLLDFSWDDADDVPGTRKVKTSLVINPGESIIFLDEVTPDDDLWSNTWRQLLNNLVVIAKDEVGGIGFSSLQESTDEVNFYDDKGQKISSVSWGPGDVNLGVSLEFDTTGTLIGSSVDGVNGAYTSNSGDVGSPGNMAPIGLDEFLVNKVTLYPNPASNKVFIRTANHEVKNVQVSSLTGKMLYGFETSEELIELNTASMVKGVYIISIEIKGAKASRKLIIQ
ncbi:MAG: T9SS type A sorting domain-containing protein [Owenweeksia sp.]